MRRTLDALLSLSLVLLPWVGAQNTVQDLWNLPDYPDYTSSFTAGSTVNISWQDALVTQFAPFCPDCNINNVDLWLTSSDYYRKLESGINLTETNYYLWTVNIDDNDVENSSDWTLRFLPADVAWGSQNQEISSAKFNLDPAPEPSPSPTPTPTSTATTTTKSEQTNTTSPTTDPNPANSDDGGLSTGAKAGIGVGVGVGGLILIALAFFLWRRLRALPAQGPDATVGGPPPMGGEMYGTSEYFAGPPMAKSAPVPPRPPTELPGDSNASELDAGEDARRPPAELDAGRPQS
ncbi:hypothetical protein BJX61DRAFT_308389 [Aspergillus egyptiacus]|nr:hypothetical protein BJX61DRAFT_308389 [Aspergillus egyptiacus]